MSQRRRSGGIVVAGLVAVAVVLLVVLTATSAPVAPYDIDSSAPDGYRALALLAGSAGAVVRESTAEGLISEPADVVIVPQPSRSTEQELESLQALAARGSTLVLGERPVEPGAQDPPLGLPVPSHRELAETPARPAQVGVCTIDGLDDLGPLDAAFAVPLSPLAGEDRCYGDEGGALVVELRLGSGSVVTLADPLLWANARLQPAKESGGQPLDNAAMALRIIGPGQGVSVAVVRPGAAGVAMGTRHPLALLPTPVKLALAQAAVALVLWLWWRGSRLGRPVSERLPVRIAASELVLAVGDLMRRRRSAARAACALRHDVRRELSQRTGVPAGAPPAEVVEVVASRTGRPVAEVAALLLDPPYGGAPVNPDDLVRLVEQLDTIRKEVLDDQPVG
jgi:hypothetical protein